MVGVGSLACIKRPEFCSQSLITEDGEFRTFTECISTASNIEGPYYLADAPIRNDLRVFGDDGVSVSISGKIVQGDCSSGLSGAKIGCTACRSQWGI